MPDLTITTLTAELMSLSRRLSDAQRELARASDEAARARHRAKHANAKAFLAAEGAMELRKAVALVETAQHQLDAEVAESALEIAKAAMREITTRIEVGRSLVASARSEAAAEKWGGAA